MIPLLDTSPARIQALAEECGFGDSYGQLLTPLTRYSDHGGRYAIDNGGYSRADAEAWIGLLDRQRSASNRCLWVTAPDVVGDARRTLELLRCFDTEILTRGFKTALAAQDGMEDLDIPWRHIEAIFIGGTTSWKMSSHAAGIIKAAQWLRKPVHVGRINTADRWEHFAKLGADTFDGSSLVVPYPGHDLQRAGIAAARQSHGKNSTARSADAVEGREGAGTVEQLRICG